MKCFLQAFFALLTLNACSSSTKKKTPKDYHFIEIPKIININPRKKLSEDMIRNDIEQILYGLDKVYSGKIYLPKNQYKILINRLQSLKKPMTAIAFCKKIDTFMEKVDDNHLNAKFNNKNCMSNSTHKKPSVGPNHYQNEDIPWSVKIETRGKYRALLIAITSFHKRSSPKWKGFLQSVQSKASKTHLIIIDMRGNGGGDDTIGMQLSHILSGGPIKTPYGRQWNNNSPDAMQVFVNYFSYWKRLKEQENQDVPKYILELIKKYEQKRDHAYAGYAVSLNDYHNSTPERKFSYKKSIKKPIYILLDAGCASSCESTTDYFESNTLVKTVGENTAGYIHFGNNGNLFLKNSGMQLQLATSYNSYKDGRFLEKRGITPKLLTPKGENAMNTAWRDFLTTGQ